MAPRPFLAYHAALHATESSATVRMPVDVSRTYRRVRTRPPTDSLMTQTSPWVAAWRRGLRAVPPLGELNWGTPSIARMAHGAESDRSTPGVDSPSHKHIARSTIPNGAFPSVPRRRTSLA